MKSSTYYHGVPGRKFGIWNTAKKAFQFGICEDTPMLPPGVKESLGMMLEEFGGRVRCVSVSQKGNEQITMDAWKTKGS